jgi:hypothetical protein
VEHAHPTGRSFSWRGVALGLGLLVVLALAALVARTLVHRLDGTLPVSDTGSVGKARVAPVALRPRSHIRVLVLNGNGTDGAAGGVSSRLLAEGYRSARATNAQVATYALSVILYRPGWEAAAERLAKDAHIRAIAPLDGTLPAADSGYQLVAIVGR